jgi:hypothetical protein
VLVPSVTDGFLILGAEHTEPADENGLLGGATLQARPNVNQAHRCSTASVHQNGWPSP